MKLFVVIGLGQFGLAVANTLAENGADVMAIDKNRTNLEFVQNKIDRVICADITDNNTMLDLGIGKANTVIIGLGERDFESAILGVAFLSTLGITNIVVRAYSETRGSVFLKVGATKIIYPELHMGIRTAKELLSPEIIELSNLSDGEAIAEVLPHYSFVGKTLLEMDIRKNYDVTVVAVKVKMPYVDDIGETKMSETVKYFPKPNFRVAENTVLVIVGEAKNIERFIRGQKK